MIGLSGWLADIVMSRRKPRSLAELADVHELYEEAVQNVAEQCRFVDSTYKEMRGCSPAMLCEDFCGTASAACEWVAMSRSHRAVGIDIDRAVLRWARRHRLAMLGKAQRRRIALIRGDVREVRTPPADAVTAFNFSYWIFRRRAAYSFWMPMVAMQRWRSWRRQWISGSSPTSGSRPDITR